MAVIFDEKMKTLSRANKEKNGLASFVDFIFFVVKASDRAETGCRRSSLLASQLARSAFFFSSQRCQASGIFSRTSQRGECVDQLSLLPRRARRKRVWEKNGVAINV